MQSDNFQYLIRVIYLPRVVAYLLASAVTVSHIEASLSEIIFIIGLIIYPHFLHWALGSFGNIPSSAERSLLIDAILVALLIVVNDFYPFATVSFVVPLVLSTLLIARPIWLLPVMSLTFVVCAVALGFGAEIERKGTPLSEALSSLSLVIYCVHVAFLGFRITSAMGKARKDAELTAQKFSQITSHLSRYISPQIYSSFSDVKERKSAATRKRLTVFFSDIEGFTELMDNLEEETVTRLLNEYLNTMTEIAHEHGGTVDKFMGDGIMIFFGDPLTRGPEQDALACTRMALEMRRRLKYLRGKWREASISSELHIRIGINTGYCAVGNFGSENRMDYTAVGSTVNIASRLEGKAPRDGILISGSTYQLIKHSLVCEEQSKVQVKGISRALENYTVVGERQDSSLGVVEQEVCGLQVSLNLALVDINKARKVLHQLENNLLMLEAKKRETKSTIRLLR